MKESLISFLNDVKFFLSIYTWIEVWYAVGGAVVITGSWMLVAFALSLPNPLKSILIWGFVLLFAILVPKALTSIPKK